MDVDILMRDKTVEELESLQSTLQGEMENEREELREMVGRRYRDVLDASSEVRSVHSLAESLVSAIGSSRNTTVIPESLKECRKGRSNDIHRLLALHSLLPIIANSDDMDSLNDGYALILAEQLHRSLLHSFIDQSWSSLINHLSRRLLITRRILIDDLHKNLRTCNRSDWAANELASISLVEGKGIEDLLNEYLEARKILIKDELQCGSLLNIVTEVKDTLKVVEHLFSQGELLTVLQSITSPQFRPQITQSLQSDSAFISFSSIVQEEIENVNRMGREGKIGTILTTQKINDKCTKWIEDICEIAHPTVILIMDYYESLDSLIEFVETLSHIVGSNWATLGSATSSLFINKLLGSVVIDRFKSVLSSSILSLSNTFHSSLLSLSSLSPSTLFDMRQSKFDSLLSIGISHSLYQCVHTLYTSISSLRETCNRFEKAVNDSSTSSTVSIHSVRERLADEVVRMIERLLSIHPSSSSSSIHLYLFRARTSLSLLHCHPSNMCKVLNRDGDKISKCSTLLHTSIEDSLSGVVNEVASQILSLHGTHVSEFLLSFSSPLATLDMAMEWLSIDLAEVGKVEVPLFISAKMHDALVEMNRILSSYSISHLLSRRIRERMSTIIGSHIISLYNKALEQNMSSSSSSSLPQRSLIQVLFDIRVLSSLFPLHQSSSNDWRSLISRIESLIDPFDLSLLSPLLSSNTKIAVQRIQLTISCLLVDILPSKGDQSSSISLIDLLPRSTIDYRPRIAPIPRLDRSVSDMKVSSVNGLNGRTTKNALLRGDNQMNSKASLSSFVDKLSSTWFGS